MSEITVDPITELEGEIELLEERELSAQSAVDEAERELEEITTRRGELAAGAFIGDTEAVEETGRLEERERQVRASADVARGALVSFEVELGATKAELKRTKERIARERVGQCGEEITRLEGAREEMGRQLQENYRAICRLHGQRASLANEIGDERLQREISVYGDPGRALRRWWEGQLRVMGAGR